MKDTAVVTMVYNEPVFLPIWARHYASQFGEECCYVVDHGSSDGSTSDLGKLNVIRIPRSPMHDKKRSAFISAFCSSLLEWYQNVIYVDVDEMLVVDPDQNVSLSKYCSKNEAQALNAVGLNIIHVLDSETPIDLAKPILVQRNWVRFAFAMCKPVLTRRPIVWTPGFHSSNAPMKFDRLFLFHLRHFDLPLALRRLEKTRAMPWGDGPPDHYQRWEDEKHVAMARAQAGLPRIMDANFDVESDPTISRYLTWALEFVAKNPEKKDLFYFNNGMSCAELLQIPERFRECF